MSQPHLGVQVRTTQIVGTSPEAFVRTRCSEEEGEGGKVGTESPPPFPPPPPTRNTHVFPAELGAATGARDVGDDVHPGQQQPTFGLPGRHVDATLEQEGSPTVSMEQLPEGGNGSNRRGQGPRRVARALDTASDPPGRAPSEPPR